jgi:hypothetical protein
MKILSGQSARSNRFRNYQKMQPIKLKRAKKGRKRQILGV